MRTKRNAKERSSAPEEQGGTSRNGRVHQENKEERQGRVEYIMGTKRNAKDGSSGKTEELQGTVECIMGTNRI